MTRFSPGISAVGFARLLTDGERLLPEIDAAVRFVLCTLLNRFRGDIALNRANVACMPAVALFVGVFCSCGSMGELGVYGRVGGYG